MSTTGKAGKAPRRSTVNVLDKRTISDFALEVTSRSLTGAPLAAKCLLCVVHGNTYGLRGGATKISKTVHFHKPPFRKDNMKLHMQRAHSSIWNAYLELTPEDRIKSLKKQTTFVQSIYSHMEDQVFSEPKIETRFVNLVMNSMYAEDEIEDREMAIKMFGNPIDGTDTDGTSRFPQHHVVRVHQKKFETIQQMVGIGTTFRSVINLSQIFRRMTNAEWLKGINSDMVQHYVRIVCVLNLQTLSGLMKNAWTYSIATDVGSVGSTGYMDLRIRVPTPYCSFINAHVLPIPLLTGDFSH